MRVVFLGNAPWSVPSLQALGGSSHRPALVLTREPRPAGRGNRLTPTAVADAARRLDLPLREVATARRGPGLDALAEAAPEVLVVVAYGEILPRSALDLPTVAPVNVHLSLLPELRGPAPVQRAILDGLTATGVTTMRMDEGMDTGPILLQAEEAIADVDDAGSLGGRLATIGGRLLVDTLDRLAAGTLVETPQDHTAATLAPKLTPEDERISWTEPAERTVRRVRALSPAPGAWTAFRGRRLKVFRAVASPHPTEHPPGTVEGVGLEGPLVAAPGGVVELVEVAPEGRRRMSGPEFSRGYRPESGERLG